jgi:hypothetical protein
MSMSDLEFGLLTGGSHTPEGSADFYIHLYI